MRTKLYFVITLLAFFALSALPNSFAQETLAQPSVRLVYFLPSDRPARPDRIEALRQLIKDVQQFYAEEMERHGHDRKTFRVETDTDGKPVVHHIDGKFNEDYYYEPLTDYKIWEEVFEHFDDFQHVYLIAIDQRYEGLDDGNSCGLGGASFLPSDGDTPAFSFGSVAIRHDADITPGEEILGGSAIIPAAGYCFEDNRGFFHPLRATIHELGHAFGLVHDFRDGFDSEAAIGGRGLRLTQCDAEWLSVHQCFNTKAISENTTGDIKLLSVSSLNKEIVNLRFQVSDPDGLHYAQLVVPEIRGIGRGSYGTSGLVDCKRLSGKTSTIESIVSTAAIVDRVMLQMIDANGGITSAMLPIELDAAPFAENSLDANNDHIVNSSDLISVASRLGRRGEDASDVNKDRIVNTIDVLLVASSLYAVSREAVEMLTPTEVEEWLTDANELAVENATLKKGIIVLEHLLAEIAFLSTPVEGTGQFEAVFPGHTDIVSSVAFSADEQTLASSGWDDKIRLWNAETKQHEITLIEQSLIMTVAFSPDGQTLASGNWDAAVRLWDSSTGEIKKTLRGHAEGIESIVFSPDGATLASGSADGTIRLWDPSTGELKRKLTGQGRMRSIAFSPDGATLASGSSDHTIQLWNPDTGKLKRTLRGHTDWVEDLAFSPDGNTLASGGGGSERTLRLWNPHNGQQKKEFTGYTESVSGIAFSPDGRLLASGGWGPKIRLWNTKTGKDENTLEGHTGGVISVVFSPDGRLLVSGGTDGKVRLWDVSTLLEPRRDSDVNADGVINILDLVLVSSNFGQIGENIADVNGDGIVNIVDLVLVAGEMGAGADAPSAHLQTPDILTAADVQHWLTQAQHLDLTHATLQQGILRLQQLLAALIPKQTALLPNYPNPFNPETWIPYQLAKPTDVTLHIYAANGALVRTLALGYQVAGIYERRNRAAYWDGKNEIGEKVASGVYFYTLSAGDFTATRKMLIRK